MLFDAKLLYPVCVLGLFIGAYVGAAMGMSDEDPLDRFLRYTMKTMTAIMISNAPPPPAAAAIIVTVEDLFELVVTISKDPVLLALVLELKHSSYPPQTPH
jgi:hypothetical protein